jgi:hypothetical protein
MELELVTESYFGLNMWNSILDVITVSVLLLLKLVASSTRH